MKRILLTGAFVLALIASLAAIAYFSSLSTNGAYRAVAWFMMLILDANITSKYLRWIMLH
jgi:hypothetical protein